MNRLFSILSFPLILTVFANQASHSCSHVCLGTGGEEEGGGEEAGGGEEKEGR